MTVAVEELAVEGMFRGDPEMVFHACCYDPLSAAVLSLGEIRKMVKELFRKNKRWLGYFKGLDRWARA